MNISAATPVGFGWLSEDDWGKRAGKRLSSWKIFIVETAKPLHFSDRHSNVFFWSVTVLIRGDKRACGQT